MNVEMTSRFQEQPFSNKLMSLSNAEDFRRNSNRHQAVSATLSGPHSQYGGSNSEFELNITLYMLKSHWTYITYFLLCEKYILLYTSLEAKKKWMENRFYIYLIKKIERRKTFSFCSHFSSISWLFSSPFSFYLWFSFHHDFLGCCSNYIYYREIPKVARFTDENRSQLSLFKFNIHKITK